MPKLKVLQVVGSKRPGGAEMFALRLVRALHARKDVEVRVVARTGGWFAKQVAAVGVPMVVAPFGGFFDFSSAGVVRRAAADFQPDVVQSWMNRATRFVPKGPWARVGRLGGFYDLKYYRGRVDELVGNTQAICDYCVEHGWPSENVTMIGNFIPAPEDGWKRGRGAVRAELGLRDEDCAVLMAGRLHPVKGVDVALRALAELPENFVLLLAGEGPVRADLESLARELAVAGRVRWLGWADNITRYAAAADIWLAPSRHEPLGNTVLDGWAHEVPVVASRTGGMAGLIEDGKSGVFVEVEDVGGIVAALNRICGDAALRKALAAGGKARFEAEFSEKVIVEQYMDYYKRLAGKGKKA